MSHPPPDPLLHHERFCFSDFTEEHYRRLLQTAAASYSFRFFDEASGAPPSVYWRHDVDYSMHRAAALARIEAELGAKATYFLHLHSPWYNLLEREVTDLAIEINRLGHQIGLHFDVHYYGITGEDELDEKISWESSLLESLLGSRPTVFSFHNTNEFTLNCKAAAYGGLVNVYADRFLREMTYCSDSIGYWRYQRLMDVLEAPALRDLHVLTHPEWWQREAMAPRQRIHRCIDGRASRLKSQYDLFLREINQLNIDQQGVL